MTSTIDKQCGNCIFLKHKAKRDGASRQSGYCDMLECMRWETDYCWRHQHADEEMRKVPIVKADN